MFIKRIQGPVVDISFEEETFSLNEILISEDVSFEVADIFYNQKIVRTISLNYDVPFQIGQEVLKK